MSREALRERVQEQEEAQPTGEATVPDIPIPEIDTRLQGLKSDLDELLRRFTDEHPDVVWTRRVIADLEEQRKREVEIRLRGMAAAAGSEPGVSTNDIVLQQLKVASAEADAKVAALRARVGDYEERYKQLRAAAESVPQIDTELAQLNRDYDIIKSQYDGLVTRRESATMTGQLEETGNVANFRIIDPPRVGTEPAAPNRMLLFPLVLLGALAVGAAFGFLVSKILPTFHDIHSLREIAKRPVLGAITMLQRPAWVRARRRANYLFFGGLAGLTGGYAVLVLLIYLLPLK